MYFGMPILLENSTLADNIRTCQANGLDFIELNMEFPGYQLDDLADTDRWLAAAQEAGIFFTIHLEENLNIADFNLLVSGAYLETVRRTIAAARGLLPLMPPGGYPLILNMHMHHGVVTTLPDRKVPMYQQHPKRYLAAFARFRQLCEEWIGAHPIRICVENTDGYRPYEVDALTSLLESPVFGLTWDIGHSCATGEQDMPFILAKKTKLRHFHLHDGTERPPRNHLAFGDGSLDLRARLQVAEAAHATCVLETKTAAALAASVRWLKENGWWHAERHGWGSD